MNAGSICNTNNMITFQCTITLAQSDTEQSRTLLKIKSMQLASANSVDIQLEASWAFWQATSVTDRQRSLALQVRYGTLITRYRIAQWYPMQDLPQSCPLCGAEKDTAGHRLGACTHPSIKKQICARHSHAMHAIVQ